MAQDKQELRDLYQKHLEELKNQGVEVDIILDTTPEDSDWVKESDVQD